MYSTTIVYEHNIHMHVANKYMDVQNGILYRQRGARVVCAAMTAHAICAAVCGSIIIAAEFIMQINSVRC